MPPDGSGPNLVTLTSPSDTVAAGPDGASTTSSRRWTRSAPATSLPSADPDTRRRRASLQQGLQRHGRLLELAAFRDSHADACRTSRCRAPAASPIRAGDRQRLQGGVRLHPDRPGRQGTVLRREQLRLAAQPRPARASWPTGSSSATSPTRRTCCSSAGSPRAELQRGGRQLVLGRAVADPGRLGRLPGMSNQRPAFVKHLLPRRRDRAEPVGPEPVHDDAHLLPAATRLQHRLPEVLRDNDSGGTWLFDDEAALAGPGRLPVHRHPDRRHRPRRSGRTASTPACSTRRTRA